MAHKLDEYIGEIAKIFKTTDNKYEAHLKSYPTLYKMAEEDEVIFEAVRRNMVKPNFFDKKLCTPDFHFFLAEHPEFSLHTFFFGPNKEKKTDISYSTMHHHDDFLLSTINAKGPGYTSLIFKPGYDIDRENQEAKIELEKFVLHAPNHIEFIQSHTAHTVFYPEATTMTYGLWSTFYPTSRLSKLKNTEFVKKNRQLIRNTIDSFKIKVRNLGIPQYREDYFYPENGKLKFLSGQVLPPQGEHFTQNFFHIVKEFIKFDDSSFLKDVYSKLKKEDNPDSLPWIERVIENESIARNYDSYDMYVPKRNVPLDEYKKVYNF